MGDSIAAAVRATPDAAGWLILPGDLPLVQPATLRQVARTLADGAQSGRWRAVQPSYQGDAGHPVGFAAGVPRAICSRLEGRKGAAPVLQALRDAGPVAESGARTTSAS